MSQKRQKRETIYLSLSPGGVTKLNLLMEHYRDRHPSDTIERCIHREANKLPKEIKDRLAKEQRLCPYAGKCKEMFNLNMLIMNNPDIQEQWHAFLMTNNLGGGGEV